MGRAVVDRVVVAEIVAQPLAAGIELRSDFRRKPDVHPTCPAGQTAGQVLGFIHRGVGEAEPAHIEHGVPRNALRLRHLHGAGHVGGVGAGGQAGQSRPDEN